MVEIFGGGSVHTKYLDLAIEGNIFNVLVVFDCKRYGPRVFDISCPRFFDDLDELIYLIGVIKK